MVISPRRSVSWHMRAVEWAEIRVPLRRQPASPSLLFIDFKDIEKSSGTFANSRRWCGHGHLCMISLTGRCRRWLKRGERVDAREQRGGSSLPHLAISHPSCHLSLIKQCIQHELQRSRTGRSFPTITERSGRGSVNVTLTGNRDADSQTRTRRLLRSRIQCRFRYSKYRAMCRGSKGWSINSARRLMDRL